MASFINRLQFQIRWSHCDPAGIVFNGRFYEFFDWGTWALFEAALGVKQADLLGTFDLMGLPLVDAGAQFLGPTRFGDVAELHSQVTAFRRSSFDVAHRLLVGDQVTVEGQETRVWAGRDPANPDRIRSKPIPADVVARFEAQ